MEKRGQHGILYRGASGDLWFLRDDWDHPRRFKDDQVHTAFSAHAEAKPLEDFMGTDLPENIMKILNELFGPLTGAWWVWGP
jgi:hypothetical protein